MGIMKAAKQIRPVSNWRYFYRKWSFWIIGMIPTISALQLFLPEIEGLFPPTFFFYLKIALSIVGFIASQIKQRSIEVPPNPDHPEDQTT